MSFPDAVLFDMDGLLLDSERLSMESFSATTQAFGLGDHETVFMSVIGSNEMSLLAILEEALGDRVDIPEFRQAWAARYHTMVTEGELPLKSGVLELLDWLGQRKIRMAVATSSSTPIATTKLRRTGIIDHFDHIVGGDTVINSKPHPEIFLKAAARVGADPVRTLVLEDSTNGVRAGVAGGFTVIQVPDLVAPSAELLSLGHRVCSSLLDVIDWLEAGQAGGARFKD